MEKVGIIGTTGMLGHHTAKVVQENPDLQLVVLHRETSNLSSLSDLQFESRITDLNDKQSLINAFKGLDYVLNCGAYYPTTPRLLKEEIATAKIQMQNFIDAVAESAIQKALYLGGSIAIPKSVDGIGTEEGVYEEAPNNKSAYVQVKWLMDAMAREAGKKGIPIVIGIPSMTFGEYDFGPSTGRIITNVVNDTLPGYVNGNRNIVYAGDAGRGLLLACLHGKIGERYLITGENIAMEDLIKTILKVAKKDTMPKQVSLGLAKILSKIKTTKYKLFGGEVPLLNDTAIAVMSAGQFLDGSKSAKELGYKPTLNAEQMITQTLQWFQKNGYITSQT